SRCETKKCEVGRGRSGISASSRAARSTAPAGHQLFSLGDIDAKLVGDLGRRLAVLPQIARPFQLLAGKADAPGLLRAFGSGLGLLRPVVGRVAAARARTTRPAPAGAFLA